MATADAGVHVVAETDTAPLLIDFGRKKAKDVRKLRKGKGKLVEQIQSTITELRSAGTISTTAQPVIVVVTEKPGSRGMLSLLNL